MPFVERNTEGRTAHGVCLLPLVPPANGYATFPKENMNMRQKFFNGTQWIGWMLSLGLLAIVAGCGKTAHVAGRVTYQGRPVVYGSVILVAADNKARSGVIEPDGSYAVEGIWLGPAKIAVISPDPSKGRRARRDEPPPRSDNNGKPLSKTPPPGWFPLPTRFEDPAASGLTCVVDSSRVSHDIEMK